jgi:hypothetical protein
MNRSYQKKSPDLILGIENIPIGTNTGMNIMH